MHRVFTGLMKLSSRKIATIYLAFGVFWIGTTDRMVVQFAQTQSQLVWIQSVKGWVFVALSATLVFGLVSVRESQLRTARDRLRISTEQLQVIHRVFRHNLGNELTVVRGYVETVKSALDQDDLEHQLTRAHKAVSRLEELNDDLEILETVEMDEPYTEAIDLLSVIEAECDRLQSQHQSITIDVEMPDTVKVSGYDLGMRLLVRRALEAATIRYTASSDAMNIDLTVTQTSKEVSLQIHSVDHSIPESEVAPLQAGKETPLAHAQGVDLWVLKWLANLFDGEVDIEVTPGHTTIEVSLLPVTQLEQITESIA
jgi:light-regulated signal transduction histidine kinase (bacteriophytochrome)